MVKSDVAGYNRLLKRNVGKTGSKIPATCRNVNDCSLNVRIVLKSFFLFLIVGKSASSVGHG